MKIRAERAVYVGGFGGSWGMAEGVGNALAEYYSNVEVSTFAHAMKNPNSLARASRGATVVTHSAGLVAVQSAVGIFDGIRPLQIHAVAPPDGTKSAPGLLRATFGQKSRGMTRQARRSWDDALHYARYMRQETTEVAAHPVGNLRHLGSIAGANTIAFAQESSIPTTMYAMLEDYYFDWTGSLGLTEPGDTVEFGTTPPVRVIALAGQHDALAMRPQEVVHAMQLG